MKKRMKLAVKANILSIMTTLLIFFCAFSVFLVSDANKMLDERRDQHIAMVNYIEDLRATSTALTMNVRSYAATNDISYYNAYNDIITNKVRENSIEQIKQIGISDDEILLLDKIISFSNELAEIEKHSIEHIKEGSQTALTHLYEQDYENGVASVNSSIEEFKVTVETRMNNSIASLNKWVAVFNILAYCAVGIVFIGQIVLMIFIIKGLIHPLVKIENKVIEFSEGNLSTPLDIEESTSEIGMTSAAINKMQKFQKAIIEDIDYLLTEMSDGNFVVESGCEENYVGDYGNILSSLKKIDDKLSDTLSEIYQSAEQVDSGSGQVAAGAQALSQGATEQASSIQELSATINEISEKVKANANNARTANDLSIESTQTIQLCKEKMQDMMSAIKEISDTSEKISNIIKTIDDIAFQTNVLALNATVEAARAGTAGSGFAVVADEVRNLANKSALAAKDTASLIEGSIEAVENGTKIAIDTSTALDEIVAKSEQLNDGIVQIAEASNEQAGAISQVTTGVDQISAVVQTNSATAEESAAASEELSAQAQMLKTLISGFKLN